MESLQVRTMLCLTLALMTCQSMADGFRCGSRLVLTGDSVARLTRACGQPDSTFKARTEVNEQGRQKQVSVTQLVYQRGRNKDIIVSIRDGKVVQISRG